jgi:hypothetical protein
MASSETIAQTEERDGQAGGKEGGSVFEYPVIRPESIPSAESDSYKRRVEDAVNAYRDLAAASDPETGRSGG